MGIPSHFGSSRDANLAGNSMVREIVAESVQEQRVLMRNASRRNSSPSGSNVTRFLEIGGVTEAAGYLYVQLLESVALQYAEDAVISGNGYFEVSRVTKRSRHRWGNRSKFRLSSCLIARAS